MAVHFDLPPGQWWACQEPERPQEDGVWYAERCHRCLLAAQASLAVQGDSLIEWWGLELAKYPGVDVDSKDMPLSEAIALSLRILEEEAS